MIWIQRHHWVFKSDIISSLWSARRGGISVRSHNCIRNDLEYIIRPYFISSESVCELASKTFRYSIDEDVRVPEEGGVKIKCWKCQQEKVIRLI